LFLLDVVLWQTGGPAADGLIHVTFLNVGDGDAVLVRTPSGQRLLVNGGPSPSALLNGLGDHLSFWDRSMDGLLVTQGDNAHMDGLRGLPERYRAREVFVSPGVDAEARWKVWSEESGIPASRVVRPGARLILSDNVVIDAMGGEEDVLLWRISWGKACFLLPGPLKPSDEKAMVRKWGRELRCQVLLAPDMGRKGSSTEEFVGQVSPRYVVFSIGKRSRRYHRPDADIVLRYVEAGARIWYTDRKGEAEFVSDGRDVWLRGESPDR
jgi:competence protein ComEC